MALGGDTILRVDRVSKLYARRNEAMRKRIGSSALRAFFGLPAPGVSVLRQHEFWALKDVSFSLDRGEALGVIGLNGSGKTTLLRIIAGQLLPDQGEVWINGSSAAMIDLRAGFQPGASGRENIFLRAAALGFERKKTESVVDEIIDFTELGDAIEAPMSGYSSGMQMRLAFAVMAMVSPDVLFIDETLSVGDFRFRQKCLAKIREIRARSSFVLVSHSMNDISRFCDRVIVLDKGKIAFQGAPEDAINAYRSINEDKAAEATTSGPAEMGPSYINEEAIGEVEHYWCDESASPVERVGFEAPVRLYVRFVSRIHIRNLIVGVPIWNQNKQFTTGLSTQLSSEQISVKPGEEVRLMAEIDGGLINPGVVKSVLGIVDGLEYVYRQPNPDLVVDGAAHPTWGAFTAPHRWRRLEAKKPADGAAQAMERI